MRRREFVASLAVVAAAWPVAACGQQRPVPVIGYLSSRSSESDASMLGAFRRGLNEAGYVEGRNLAIEYRFAEGEYGPLPALATDLIGRHVGVIVVVGVLANTEMVRFMWASPIPIVFVVGIDPVRYGLVSSMNRPGGNMTGVSNLNGELMAKRVGLLHELVPNAKTMALVIDAALEPGRAAGQMEGDAREAAAMLGLQLLVLI
jgi:ABC-type uncharacterized transport system substrate-binding protein